MLYIFSGNKGLRIAWGSRAPGATIESRAEQMDPRIARLRFIRTRNAG